MRRIITVCDDEQGALRQLAFYLDKFQEETGDEFHIFYFSSGETLLAEMPRDTQVLFLDIGMGKLSGMDAARKLRDEDLEFYLIFTTSLVEYALEGYEVQTSAFMRKPLLYETMCRNLKDIFRRIDERSNAIITVSDRGGTDIIDADEIIYVEVFRHNTCFVFADRKKEYNLPLSSIEGQISKYGFFRCHKSYLVNMKQIQRIEPTSLYMINGDLIPVSKHRRREFLDIFSGYMGARL